MTSKTISPNTLTSSGKLDSRAKPDGSAKMTVIRSDQFATTKDNSFYSNSVGSFRASWSNDLVGGNAGGKIKLTFDENSESQLAFQLPQIYDHIIFDYDLYIPSNYNQTTNANNKFFRIWQTSYTDTHQCGASLRPNAAHDGGSRVYTERRAVGGPGTGEVGGISYDQFITVGDLGTWVHVTMEFTAPVYGNNTSVDYGDGKIEIYKNRNLVAWNYGIPSMGGDVPQGWKEGYIMGFTNSPLENPTYIYIDNFVVRGE